MQVIKYPILFHLIQVVKCPLICLGHPFYADFVMSETFNCRCTESMYGTATSVPNDTSFIGDGKDGSGGWLELNPSA